MAISYNKKELEKKKQSKKLEKQKRKEERKANSESKSFDDMIAYVDENGNITNTPPDPTKFKEVDIETIVISTPKKEEQEESILTGRIEYLNQLKGFGFIKDIHSTEKYFFHVSNTEDAVEEGNMVSFSLKRGHKGMDAVNVVLIK